MYLVSIAMHFGARAGNLLKGPESKYLRLCGPYGLSHILSSADTGVDT